MAGEPTTQTSTTQISIVPIDPISHITSHRPTDEAAKTVANWYATETMELNFGDYVGRPNENVVAHREQLSALFADGWYVVAVSNSQASGEWKKVTTRTELQSVHQLAHDLDTMLGMENVKQTVKGKSQSSSQSSSQASSQSSSESQSQNSSETSSQASSKSKSVSRAGYNVWYGRDQTSTQASGISKSINTGVARATSVGSANDSANEKATGTSQDSYQDSTQTSSQKSSQTSSQKSSQSSSQGSTTITEDGDPYYCAWMKIKLQRKRMQSDKVLQSMVDTLVSQFNDGRTINIDRYDELVSLYALLLNRVETEGNALLDDSMDFMPFFDDIKAKVEDALAKLAEVASNLPTDWMQSRIDEINRRFDAIKGQEQAKYTSMGMWNTSMSASVDAGVERERQYALNNLRDEMVTLKIEAFGKIADITASVGNNLIGAQVRIFEALQQKKIEPINMRNTVFKWMLDFMERREDPYPQIDELPTVAERLGYSGGIAFPSQQGA